MSKLTINKRVVEEAKEIIKEKENFFKECVPSLVFDENGRAKIGAITEFSEYDFSRAIRSSADKIFLECLEQACAELRLENIRLNEITYDQFLSRRIKVRTLTGFEQERSLPAILDKAHKLWEKRTPLYRPIRTIYREVAKSGNREKIEQYKEILRKLENGNTYIAYDELMRTFQPTDLLLSINPLDKVFASGGYKDHLTSFSSCWSNKIQNKKDSIIVEAGGSYANPRAQYILGSHPNSCMVIAPNNRSKELHGMKLIGMLQRSHAWIQNGELFIEEVYPQKSQERLNTFTNQIKNIMPVKDGDINEKIKAPSGFRFSAWRSDLDEALSTGKSIYLDRSKLTVANVIIGSR